MAEIQKSARATILQLYPSLASTQAMVRTLSPPVDTTTCAGATSPARAMAPGLPKGGPQAWCRLCCLLHVAAHSMPARYRQYRCPCQCCPGQRAGCCPIRLTSHTSIPHAVSRIPAIVSGRLSQAAWLVPVSAKDRRHIVDPTPCISKKTRPRSPRPHPTARPAKKSPCGAPHQGASIRSPQQYATAQGACP